MPRSTFERMVSRPLAALAVAASCVIPSAWAADPSAALLDSPVRNAKDQAQDASRKPLELLKFAQVKPGMQVLDVASGGGYTAQVLALAVGPTGKVWAQVAKPSPALEARLAANQQPNLVIVNQPFETLLPADAPRVDLVTLILSYHDIVNTPVDRAKMNKAMFDALKPGGHLVVIDHATKPGVGTGETATLHRIEEKTVRDEVTAAGFRVEADSDAWRNPSDPRQEHWSKMTIPTDHFALRFVKPQ